MKFITVCVDYADLFQLTFEYNKSLLQSNLFVVTSTTDSQTHQFCQLNKIPFLSTHAFYDDGAVFNKWKALEQGLDVMGRKGWIGIIDADILFPKHLKITETDDTLELITDRPAYLTPSTLIRKGELCTPYRFMLENINGLTVHNIPDEDRWYQFPLHPNHAEWAGYCQIFHADDPVLRKKQPTWHEVNWRHAGGADSFFQALWSPKNKVRPYFEVVHLGPSGANWCGRATEYIDGTKPPDAQRKANQLAEFLNNRKKTRNYGGEKL